MRDNMHGLRGSKQDGEVDCVDPDLLGSWIGFAFCALVGIQLLYALIGAQLQYVDQRKAARLRLTVLDEQIKTASLRRRVTPVTVASWQGYRRFVVKALYRESLTARSIHLVPQDRRPLPRYFPGQFLTLRFELPDHPKKFVRCYSLSDRPRQDYFRCTIKAQGAGGTEARHEPSVSRFVNVSLEEGDVIDVMAPSGEFVLDLFDRRPAALLAAGIGITPLLSMLRTVAHEQTGRELTLFYGVRNSHDHAFADELQELSDSHPNIRVITFYSRPLDSDVSGHRFDRQGRIDIESVREILESPNYEFFLCGPGRFIEQLSADLRSWQVPEHRIRSEAFGPSAKPTDTRGEDGPADGSDANSSVHSIRFLASDTVLSWADQEESILDCAEAHGIELPASCRAGNCGTCVSRLISGSVDYPEPPTFAVAEQECLPCIARPRSDVVIDQ